MISNNAGKLVSEKTGSEKKMQKIKSFIYSFTQHLFTEQLCGKHCYTCLRESSLGQDLLAAGLW